MKYECLKFWAGILTICAMIQFINTNSPILKIIGAFVIGIIYGLTSKYDMW